MKYTMERLPESRVAIDVEIEPEAVEKALDRAARRISQKARIPGFRPGKAPRYIIEARFGRASLYEEAGDDIVRQAYEQILKEKEDEINPVGQAEVESFNMEPFTFRLVIPVVPTVKLSDYRALRFPMELHQVTDEDIDHAIKHLQDEQTVWHEPAEPRPARNGDRLVVDLAGKVDETGEEIENQEGAELVIGDESLLQGFSETLTGVEPEQTVEVHTTLLEEMEDDKFRGKAATYTVTVRGIKEPEIPALDDEFAKSLGQDDETMEELRARLRKELEETAARLAREDVLEKMLASIIGEAEVDMPHVLVDREADALYQEQADELRTYQLSMAQYLSFTGKTEEQYREELHNVAPERLGRFLVMQELMRAEGLTGQGEELRQALEERLLAIARGDVEVAEEAETAETAGTAEKAEEAESTEEAEGAETAEGTKDTEEANG